MHRKMNSNYYALRWKILERDNFTCQYCGQYAPNVKLEVDHKIPVEDGGTDQEDNLTTSCYACNRGKSGLHIINTRTKQRMKRTYVAPENRPSITDKVKIELDKHPEGLSNTVICKMFNISLAYGRTILMRGKKKNIFKKNNNLWFSIK